MRKTEVNENWDTTDSEKVQVPTLLINGEYDFEADDVCAPFFRQMVKFTYSARMLH